MDYKVHIVITTYNRLDYTKQSLPSLLQTASDTIPYMISVFDNGSADDTPKYLQELFDTKQITNLILHPTNLGVARAHNIFWSMFSDKVPIYGKVDNDILFNKKGWLADTVKILDNCPGVAMAGCSVEWEILNGIRTPKPFTPMIENGVPYRFKNDNLGGACVFIPKRTHDILGYWNEGYALYGEEDTDYGFRTRLNNLRNVYLMDLDYAYHLDDYSDAEYSTFKDNERKKNTSGIFWETLNKYRQNPGTHKINTNVLNEIKFNLQSNIQGI